MSTERTDWRKRAADRPQQPVPHIVASRIVHGLEMVEVEEHDADALALSPAPFQSVGHPVFEQAPVGQARQVVVHGLVGKRPLRSLLLGDVADDLGNAGHAAPTVTQGGQADRDLDPGPVLAHPYRLDAPDDLACPGPGQELRRLQLSIRWDEHGQRSAQRLFFFPPEQLFRRRGSRSR